VSLAVVLEHRKSFDLVLEHRKSLAVVLEKFEVSY